jgi:hypothetical protein
MMDVLILGYGVFRALHPIDTRMVKITDILDEVPFFLRAEVVIARRIQ